jgi:hypothetical protein
VEFVLARPGEPGSGITVGAHAMGRRHSPPAFPDTELRFDITAAMNRLGATRAATLSVVPLDLGSGHRDRSAFAYDSIDVLGLPA